MNAVTTSYHNVFGVGNIRPLSYVERIKIDDGFQSAMTGPNPVIVYGASKQGKTALVSRYVSYEDNVVCRLTPKTTLKDIYHAILREHGIEIEESLTMTTGVEGSAKIGSKWVAKLPFIGSADISGEAAAKKSVGNTVTKKRVAFNLELPQDIGELLRNVLERKIVILENFHYLTLENQRTFAFDLRTFQEIGVKFLILGVWKEKDRMTQFNGDLMHRINEIAVEPWTETYLMMVARTGESHLRVKFSTQFLTECANAAFGSIGVFQEIMKGVCAEAKVDAPTKTQRVIGQTGGSELLDVAKKNLVLVYEGRHLQCLMAIASKRTCADAASDLFLPYYFVAVILENGHRVFQSQNANMFIFEEIKKVHRRPSSVELYHVNCFLNELSGLQAEKYITPPLFDYDRTSNSLHIVDSTFNFFIKNANLYDVRQRLQQPF